MLILILVVAHFDWFHSVVKPSQGYTGTWRNTEHMTRTEANHKICYMQETTSLKKNAVLRFDAFWLMTGQNIGLKNALAKEHMTRPMAVGFTLRINVKRPVFLNTSQRFVCLINNIRSRQVDVVLGRFIRNPLAKLVRLFQLGWNWPGGCWRREREKKIIYIYISMFS